MSDNKIVEMFDSIPKFDYFSKYSFSLQKVFQNSSLKNFIKELKSPKKINVLQNQNEQVKFYDDNNIIDLDNNLDSNMIKKENIDFFNKKYDEKNMKKNHSFKQFKSNKIISLKKKSFLPFNPDPCKYNPNYNAIYKNVPSVKIMKPIKYISPLKKKESSNISIEKKNKVKIPKIKQSLNLNIINNYKNKSLENKNIYNIQNSSTNLTTNNNYESNIINKINNTEGKLNKSKSQNKYFLKKNYLPLISKNNHALKFSHYTSRKYIIPTKLDKLTYLEPINYFENINKVIDFNKMNSRTENILKNPSFLENPSICYYEPKYNFIDQKSPIISFCSPKKQLKKSKKFLLKKLWGSYNFSSDYQLIDNNKLNQSKKEL